MKGWWLYTLLHFISIRVVTNANAHSNVWHSNVWHSNAHSNAHTSFECAFAFECECTTFAYAFECESKTFAFGFECHFKHSMGQMLCRMRFKC